MDPTRTNVEFDDEGLAMSLDEALAMQGARAIGTIPSDVGP